MERFSREAMAPFFMYWEAHKQAIDKLYKDNHPNAQEKMKEALKEYTTLLRYGEVEDQIQSLLLPLNGEERLAFIEKQIASRYAFVQLDALYDESRKRAARLSLTYKN